MHNLLMDDRPILFLPKLAKALGSCERAIIVQQIHWLLNQPHSGLDAEGYHWVWGKYEEWCELYFPMWGERNLRKHITRLENEGVIISAQLRAHLHDQTKFYRVNYDHALFSGEGSSTSIRNSSSTSARNNRSTSSGNNSSASYNETETSSETSSDNQDDDDLSSEAEPDAIDLEAIRDLLMDELDAADIVLPDDQIDYYTRQCDRYGLAAVCDALERAARRDKHHIRAYVDRCIETIVEEQRQTRSKYAFD